MAFGKYILQKVIYNTQKPPFTGWHDDLSSIFADDEDCKGARPDVGGNDGSQGHDEDLVDGWTFQETVLEGLGPVQVCRIGHDGSGVGQVLAGQLQHLPHPLLAAPDLGDGNQLPICFNPEQGFDVHKAPDDGRPLGQTAAPHEMVEVIHQEVGPQPR